MERVLTGRPGFGEDYSQVATVPHRLQVEKLPCVLVGAKIAEKIVIFSKSFARIKNRFIRNFKEEY